MEEYLGRRVGEIECEVQCIVFHSGCKLVQWMYLSIFVQSMLLVRWTIIDRSGTLEFKATLLKYFHLKCFNFEDQQLFHAAYPLMQRTTTAETNMHASEALVRIGDYTGSR